MINAIKYVGKDGTIDYLHGKVRVYGAGDVEFKNVLGRLELWTDPRGGYYDGRDEDREVDIRLLPGGRWARTVTIKDFFS